MKTTTFLSCVLFSLAACRKETNQCFPIRAQQATRAMAPGAAYYTFDFSKGSKGWDVEGPANFKYNADTGNTAPLRFRPCKKASGSWYFKAPAKV